MSKLDGIKDFIKENKESLEKMNEEMLASYGRAPLVWLTVEEAKRALGCIQMSRAVADDIEGKDKELQIKLQERIEQTNGASKGQGMKYRIKSPEVEKAVRYLFKCNFPKNGLTAYEVQPEARLVRFYIDEKSSVSNCNLIFELHESLVEGIIEYNPKAWNDFSKVKPPKQEFYRVEWRDAQGICRHRGVHWFDEHYFMAAFESMYGPLTAFFKPWDDEEGKE